MRYLIVALMVSASACTTAPGTGATAPPVDLPSGEVTMTSRPVEAPDDLVAEILSDGRVTHAEMERALLATVECVRDAGYKVELNYFRPRIGWSFGLMGDDPLSVEAADVEKERCSSRFVTPISDEYFAQNGLSEAEQASWDRTFLECLRQQGNDVDGREIPEVLADPAVVGVVGCRDAADGTVGGS